MSTTADTSPADLSVRTARPDDSDGLFALLLQLEPEYTPDRVAFAASFALLAAGDDTDGATSSILVADEAGQPVGYALVTITTLLHANGRSAQLQELVVDESRRGTGVGTVLIEAVEALCRAQAVRQLTVPSRRSADFYERLGYTSTADFLKRTFD